MAAPPAQYPISRWQTTVVEAKFVDDDDWGPKLLRGGLVCATAVRPCAHLLPGGARRRGHQAIGSAHVLSGRATGGHGARFLARCFGRVGHGSGKMSGLFWPGLVRCKTRSKEDMINNHLTRLFYMLLIVLMLITETQCRPHTCYSTGDDRIGKEAASVMAVLG